MNLSWIALLLVAAPWNLHAGACGDRPFLNIPSLKFTLLEDGKAVKGNRFNATAHIEAWSSTPLIFSWLPHAGPKAARRDVPIEVSFDPYLMAYRTIPVTLIFDGTSCVEKLRDISIGAGNESTGKSISVTIKPERWYELDLEQIIKDGGYEIELPNGGYGDNVSGLVTTQVEPDPEYIPGEPFHQSTIQRFYVHTDGGIFQARDGITALSDPSPIYACLNQAVNDGSRPKLYGFKHTFPKGQRNVFDGIMDVRNCSQ